MSRSFSLSHLGRHSTRIPRFWAVIAGVFSLGLLASPAWPCSTFLAQHAGQPVFGRNYDWNDVAALVVLNPAGLAKKAVVLDPRNPPAQWESKYASVTFNQYGVELPTGGMNEKGLVVEIMWQDSEYPVDDRPALNELQWVQYALDRAATVDELIAAVAEIRVVQAYAQVHYLACDAGSHCAAFEYLKGQLVVTTGADLVVPALTNSTYADSVAYLRDFEGFGGTKPMPTSTESLDRFVRVSMLAKQTAGTTIPSSAFSILDSVAQDPFTQWRIVYLPKEGTVYFRTNGSAKLRSVKLPASGLDCTDKRKAIAIDADLEGDVSPLMLDYTDAMGMQLLARSLAGIAASLPPGTKELIVAYANSAVCSKAEHPSLDGGAVDLGEATTDTAGDTATDAAVARADATSPDGDQPEVGGKDTSGANSGTDSSGCSCSLNGRQGSASSGLLLACLGIPLLRARRRRTRMH